MCYNFSCYEGGATVAKKENRESINLKCSECGELNYLTNKNKVNTEGKIEMNKYCKKCNKTTKHTERKVN